MMTTDIVNEIARIIRQREPSLKDEKELKIRKAQVEAPKDEVELSKAGEFYANPVSASSEYEKEQHMKVERLKALVQSGNYKMDEDMVSNVAEKIAKQLLM